jgi:hypothetical protein
MSSIRTAWQAENFAARVHFSVGGAETGEALDNVNPYG